MLTYFNNEQWCETLDTMVYLLGMKLDDKGFVFVPRLVSNIEVPSDRLELNDQLKVLFLEKCKGLKEGVYKASLRVFNELCEKKEVLVGESSLISNRIEEFRTAIRTIEEYLEQGEKEEIHFQDVRFVR
ncbi:hypothetical protein SASPL_148744 [Salvia splendens]|uniref:Uncharacterized protein n=1 Tax=Salvia splendens TaxID=180675 RepID=A0A8X8W9W6_SALSN|nr:hypothetical protein SASPL_148744 [Salvia splendens]